MNSLFNEKIDCYLIFSPSNRFYFTKFKSTFGCVLLTPTEKVFFTDSRYFLSAQNNIKGFNIVCVNPKDLYIEINEWIKKLKCKNIGYEEKYLTGYDIRILRKFLKGLSLRSGSFYLENIRMIKTEEEINFIKDAQIISERTLSRVIELIKIGMSEKEVSNLITIEALKHGADCMSFDTIVAFGKNTAVPHHSPSSNTRLEKNDLILIDFGAKYNGYCSDMTRTFCLNNPKEELELIHNIVLSAQQYALKYIKAGMTCHEADSLAREYIKANGYDKNFTHSLGHGLGIDIHEMPRLTEHNNFELKENMVISVEPGIYIENIGGVRIEDIVVIKKDGIINLTNFNKSLDI